MYEIFKQYKHDLKTEYKKYKDYGANYMILVTTPSYNTKTIKL